MKTTRVMFLGMAAAVAFTPPAARASFHLMQIEQIIAGVNGDTSAQAIQLRMRAAGQNQVQLGQLIARDASGANPVTIATFTDPVGNSSTGDRVLIVSTAFASRSSPSAVADQIMTNPIPASYLAAGSLTFENISGSIHWRISWGGAGYTGATTGNMNNDADGNFGSPVAAALPSDSLRALKFQGTADAASSRNVDDYALTTDAAVFVNNAGASFTVIAGSGGASSTGMSLCGLFGMVESAALVTGLVVYSTYRRRRTSRA